MVHWFANGGEHLTEVRLLHQTVIVWVQAAKDFSGSRVLGLGSGKLVLINGLERREANVFGWQKVSDSGTVKKRLKRSLDVLDATHTEVCSATCGILTQVLQHSVDFSFGWALAESTYANFDLRLGQVSFLFSVQSREAVLLLFL